MTALYATLLFIGITSLTVFIVLFSVRMDHHSEMAWHLLMFAVSDFMLYGLGVTRFVLSGWQPPPRLLSAIVITTLIDSMTVWRLSLLVRTRRRKKLMEAQE